MTQRGSVRIAKTDPKCMSEEAESCGKAAAGTVLPFLQKQADIVNIYKKTMPPEGLVDRGEGQTADRYEASRRALRGSSGSGHERDRNSHHQRYMMSVPLSFISVSSE